MYEGICSNEGIDIYDDDAFEYALEKIKNDESEKAEFIEWFYSGNWIHRPENQYV